jgi:hypothetical protein
MEITKQDQDEFIRRMENWSLGLRYQLRMKQKKAVEEMEKECSFKPDVSHKLL